MNSRPLLPNKICIREAFAKFFSKGLKCSTHPFTSYCCKNHKQLLFNLEKTETMEVYSLG